METAILISGLVGTMEVDFFKNAINTSIITLQNSLNYIKNGSHENELFERVRRKIHEFDIELQFKLAQKYIEVCKDATMASYLVSSIDAVNNLTEKIRLKISGHRKLWFHSYRFCNVESDLCLLESEVKLLEKRIVIVSKFSKLISK